MDQTPRKIADATPQVTAPANSAKKRVVAEVVSDRDERVILTAKRRFGKENQESCQDETPDLRGKFTLKGSFEPVVPAEKPAFDFTKAFKQLQLNKPAEGTQTEPAKVSLSKEKKVFVNKNLFNNPTIRPLPPVRSTDDDRPTPKLQAEEQPALVRENFLSSSKALKYKDEVANPPRIESPIVKSLFDFKGNEIYKEETKV